MALIIPLTTKVLLRDLHLPLRRRTIHERTPEDLVWGAAAEPREIEERDWLLRTCPRRWRLETEITACTTAPTTFGIEAGIPVPVHTVSVRVAFERLADAVAFRRWREARRARREANHARVAPGDPYCDGCGGPVTPCPGVIELRVLAIAVRCRYSGHACIACGEQAVIVSNAERAVLNRAFALNARLRELAGIVRGQRADRPGPPLAVLEIDAAMSDAAVLEAFAAAVEFVPRLPGADADETHRITDGVQEHGGN